MLRFAAAMVVGMEHIIPATVGICHRVTGRFTLSPTGCTGLKGPNWRKKSNEATEMPKMRA